MDALFLLLLMMVLGGGIAYAADVIGRRIGKKKLTFRKLRPKHTAVLMVTLAGVLIPLVTFGILMLASRDTREWLLRGRAIIDEIKREQKDLDNVRVELAKRQLEVENAQKKLTKANQDRDKVQAQSQKLRSQLSGVNKELERRNSALQRSGADLRRATGELRKLESDRKTLQGEKDDLSKLRDQLLKQKKTSEGYQTELDMRIQKTEQQIKEKEKQIKEKDDDISSRKSALEKLQSEYDRTNREYRAFKKQSEEEQVDSQRKLELARLNLDEAQGLMEALRQQAAATVGVSRTRPMVFGFGEEIARQTIPVGTNSEGVEATIQSLIRNARTQAVERSRGLPGAELAGAGLSEITVDGKVVTAEEQVRRIVDRVLALRADAVIIARSSWNAFSGEFVPVQIMPYGNPLVYRQGQIIADTRIEGTHTNEQVVGELTAFLQGPLREAATKKGMIPATGREASFGKVSTEDLLEAVREIRASNRRVKVIAVAAQDTRAAESLRIVFRIE